MQLNRPSPRSAATAVALAFAALITAAAAARAQDNWRLVHVLPPDSAGFLNRQNLAQFRDSLGHPPGRFEIPCQWRGGALCTREALQRFDSAVAVGRADAMRRTEHRLLLDRFMRSSYAIDTTSQSTRHGLFGLSPNTADVSFDGTYQATISSTQQRNLACTAAQVEDPTTGCRASFSAPRLDNNIVLRSTGVFAQRFHVNIDFDSKRDYAANNIVSAYYQGLEDEKLQSVEIGTVRFLPPASRFLTATIPINNFGISAAAQFGPLHVQAIAAAQKGSVSQVKTFTIGGTVVEPQDQYRRDLDYESTRLFWTVDPRTLPGYPALDVLNASAIAVPPGQQPTEVRIYRYVSADQNTGANANYDGVTAVGSNGTETTGALRWRLLRPNIDYWLDPSGLWFILATGSMDPRDYLAVSYLTRGGDTVGTFPLVDNPAANDTVRLVYLPNRTPASPLFAYEMRQAYQIGGASLVRSSLRGAILVSNSERPINQPGTYLSLLGLAVDANPAVLDAENRVFPRARDPGASQVIRDALLIFPSTRPFGDPRLTPAEQNDSMYVTPEYLLLTQGPPSKFSIHLEFDAAGGTDRSSVALDALQISEGSEHVEVNGRRLTRDVDYTMDYATGRVLFLDPNALFGTGAAQSQVTVTYDQQNLFAKAPTSIAGITATWDFGRQRSLSLVGLYQSEATGYTRPQIGYEARASLLLGLVGRATFNAPGVTSFFNRLTPRRSTAPSELDVSGEIAMSRPDPNRSGDAFLEEFENDNSIPVSAAQNAWRPGSVPQSALGLEDILPQGFDSADAVQLIWQNLVPGRGDSLVRLSPRDIDTTIVTTTSKTRPVEPVLWTTLHSDTAGGILRTTPASKWTLPPRPGQPRWRTMTTSLSPTGLDLSHNAYFEFALYELPDDPIRQSDTRIVLDLGHVSEDALSIAPTHFHFPGQPNDTFYTGRQYIGPHRLDTERTTFGTWSAVSDDIGILADRPDSLIGPDGQILRFPALCEDSLSATIQYYPWGDLGSRCTRHNGAPDTEDLDGDNRLDARGSNDDVFRYIVDLKRDSAKYFVRTNPIDLGGGRTAHWTIYRVPLRNVDETIGTPDIHLVKQLRIAFVTPPPDDSPIRFALALMKFTGAAWIARASAPIATLSGPIAEPNGAVVIGTVSTQDATSAMYTSPPGIGNSAASVGVSQSDLSKQINEKSLRIQAFDLRPGQRAEAYNRMISGTENLLKYGQMRVWFRGAPGTPGWDDQQLQAYVKVGSDAYNFYLYRTPVHTTTWNPEAVIDLQVWQDLRNQIEDARLRGAPPSGAALCGGDPTAYVACDGPYLVQVRDPLVNPPNLARVQELAAGFYYAGQGPPIARTELWVDDIRVGQPVATPGYAGTMSARLVAADVATFDLAGVMQSSQFHLMGQPQSYQNIGTVASAATVHLEKFLPTVLGLVVPVTMTGNWGWSNPELLSGTDVEARGIEDLRRPRNNASTWSFTVRHPKGGVVGGGGGGEGGGASDGESIVSRLVLDPLSVSGSGSAANTTSSLSHATSSSWTGNISYNFAQPRRTYRIGLSGLVNGLPRWLRESTAGRGIANATIAPWPTSINFTSAVSHSMGNLQAFSVPIRILADTILKPVTSEQYLWRNAATVNWQPLTILTLSSSWFSTRDLRQYPDSTTLGRVANAAHQSLLGVDVGVERDRNLANTLSFAPQLSSWLSPAVAVGTNFTLSRSTASRNPVQIDGDTAGAYILPQTLNNSRYLEYRVSVDPHILTQRVLGDSSTGARALVRFRPINFVHRHTLESTFDLATFDPGLGYQLALGGFDGFLRRQGQDAIGAGDGTSTSVSATIDLPGGFSARATYSSTSSDRYQRRPGDEEFVAVRDRFLRTSGTTESWPSGEFHWQGLFANGPVTEVQLASGIQRDRATSTSPFASGAAAISTSDTRRISPSLGITFRNGLNLTMTGEVDHTDGLNSGNRSQTESLNLTGVASWSVRLPRFISGTRRNLLTSLSVSQNTNTSCIQGPSDSTCVEYYGLRRLDVQASFAAQLEHAIRVGFSLGYIRNNVSSLNLLSSTINLSLSVSVPLSGLGM